MRNASTKTGYSKDSKGTSFAARESWGNWNGVNVVLQTDLDRDGYQDLRLPAQQRRRPLLVALRAASGSWTTKQIADNWKTRTRDRHPR